MASETNNVFETKDDPEVRDVLERSIEVLNAGIKACNECRDKSKLVDELDAKRAFLSYYVDRKKAPVGMPNQQMPDEPNVTPLKILSKPRASYTDQARQNGTSGTIRLAVLFGASGRIEYIMRLSRLGSGLDENAVKAARAIKFTPKMKDGKAVSDVRVIEYGFKIY